MYILLVDFGPSHVKYGQHEFFWYTSNNSVIYGSQLKSSHLDTNHQTDLIINIRTISTSTHRVTTQLILIVVHSCVLADY